MAKAASLPKINYARFSSQGDIILAGGVVVILLVILVPLPTSILDIMLSLSISLSLIILITSMFMLPRWSFPSFQPCSW